MRRILLVLCALMLTYCEDAQFRSREAGALGGGALGAGLGAIIGHATHNTGAGIAIGAATGALAGGVMGNEYDRQEDASNQRDQTLSEQERQLAENRRIIEELKRSGTDARMTDRGVVVNLPDVLFEFNSARLTPEARRTTADIARVLRGSDRTISVEGHTDSLGTIEYNQRLSENRAQSVAHELVGEGVQRRRLIIRGKGESDPIASNKTAAGRQRNRRVEVIIENR